METVGDPAKRDWTLEHRGLDFADFPIWLTGPHWERRDRRRNYGEERWILMGFLRQRLLVAVYTMLAKTYRVLSMRKANDREEEAFEELRGR